VWRAFPSADASPDMELEYLHLVLNLLRAFMQQDGPAPYALPIMHLPGDIRRG
jgi:hypothetical protein